MVKLHKAIHFIIYFRKIHLVDTLVYIISDVSSRGSLVVSGLSSPHLCDPAKTDRLLTYAPSVNYNFFRSHDNTLQLLLAIYGPIPDNFRFNSNAWHSIKKGSKHKHSFIR